VASTRVNLLLIRAKRPRAKEFAIRRSMGASRRADVSQVLVETILLTLLRSLWANRGAWGIRLLGTLWYCISYLSVRISAFDERTHESSLLCLECSR